MEPDQKFASVGLFVLLGVFGIVGMAVWLNGALARQNTLCYVMRFDGSVAGLSQGSTITYRGVGVGTVERIRINPENDAQILVRALLNQDTPVRNSTVARLRPQGVTGGSYIELDVKEGVTRSGRAAQRAQGCRIIETEASGIEQIVNTLPQILDRALQVTERLSQLLGTENTTNITDALANLNKLSAQLSEQTRTVAPELQGAAEELRASMANLNRLTGSLEDGTQGNLQEIQATVRQTGAAMDEIRALTEELRANPRKLLDAPKMREERVAE